MKSLTRDQNEAAAQYTSGMPVESLETQAILRAPVTEKARWDPAASAYATDHLFAIVADSRAAARATRALLTHGYGPADVQMYSGPVQARQLEELEQRRGIVRFFRAVQEALTYDAHTTRRRYSQALRQGQTVVMVYCPTDARVQRAADLLARDGGRHMVYYGRWNIQLVSPLTTVTTGEPRAAR